MSQIWTTHAITTTLSTKLNTTYHHFLSDRGRQYLQRALTPDEAVWDEAHLARCELIDKLADLDTPLAEYVLEQESLENVPAPLVREAVRRVTLSQVGRVLVLVSTCNDVSPAIGVGLNAFVSVLTFLYLFPVICFPLLMVLLFSNLVMYSFIFVMI